MSPNVVTSARYKVADKLAGRSRQREVRRARTSARRIRRLGAAGKGALAVVALAAFAFLALMVGNGDYQATAIGWVPLLMAGTAVGLAFAYLHMLKGMLEFETKSQLQTCERDSDVDFVVNFTNTGPLFFFKATATFYLSDQFGNVTSEVQTTFALGSHQTLDIPFAATFPHIGTYEAGLENVVVSDFLGLFSAMLPGANPQKVFVTPKLQTVGGMRFSQDAEQESMRATKTTIADSMDYAYVRDYELGDPLKSIHWKLSARSQGYMTRLYERASNPGVAIFLDFYADEDDARELMSLFDIVVESAFSVADHARREGMNTQVHFCGRDGQPVSLTSWKKTEMADIVSRMPAMSNDAGDAGNVIALMQAQTAAQRGQNNVVVCSANLGADLISAIIDVKLRHRTPFMMAAVPPRLVDRDREKHCAPLTRLQAAGIGHAAISHADELTKVHL